MNQNIDQKEDLEQQSKTKPDDTAGLYIRGHIKISDPETGEVFVDKPNAIHYENISEAMAYSLGNKSRNFIFEMHFGNGGTTVDPTGVITYLPTNTNVANADLYNATYYKIVDDTNVANTDPVNNKLTVSHTPGLKYTDIIVSCLLDYGEPAGQAVFDNSQNLNDNFTFDELGLLANYGTDNNGTVITRLLTHVIFHPVQKSLNRQIQIDYTLRIQTLTNLSAA